MMLRAYLFLALAILAEGFATVLLKKSEGFTRLVPSAGSVLLYLLTFYALAQSLRILNVGIANAIWAGLSIILICLLAAFFYGERLDSAAWIGMGLIIAGIVVIHFFSKTVVE